MNRTRSTINNSIWALPLIAACLFVFSGIAAAQSGQLVSADYGVNGNRVDVTSRIRSMSQDGYLNFRVANDILGFDPAPGLAKDLRIRVRDNNGRTRDYRYHEGDTVSLTLDTGGYYPDRDRGYSQNGNGYGGLRIVRARYGAGNKWMDVTSTLQNLVSNNSVSVKVNNTNMGGDPAEGDHKVLEVDWDSGNGRQRTRISEGDYLNLSASASGYGTDGGGGYPNGGYGRYSGLRIIRARYGAGNRWRDVTNILQNLASNNSINIKVNNTNLGGDPAEGDQKVLEVDWESSNGPQSTRVMEGDYLNLSDAGGSYGGPGYGSTGSYGSGNYGGYSGLRILSARYGAEGKWMDVTSRLQSMVTPSGINIKVNNTNMGGDPNDDRHKILEVEFESQGRRTTARVMEGDYLNLSAASTGNSPYYSDLRIIRASYGADDKWMDVTGTLQGLVNNNRLNIKVNNTNMGGDPNDDRHKELKIEWEYQGRRQTSHLREGDYLNIP
jgi:hypothetical protein